MSTKQKFLQIQNVMKKISEDKKLSENFINLSSEQERFSFAKSECESSSLMADYNLEDFTKFEILASIIYKIHSNTALSAEFAEMDNIESLTVFIKKQIANEKIEVVINDSEIKEFIASFLTEQMQDNDLDSVSGRGTSIDRFLSGYGKFINIYGVGNKMGEDFAKLILGIK